MRLLLVFPLLALSASAAEVSSAQRIPAPPGRTIAAAVDTAGNRIVAGCSHPTFTTCPVSTPQGLVGDAWITKATPAGLTAFTRQLPEASILAVATDNAGNIYITGESNNAMPATPGAFQTDGGPGFLTKLSPQGDLLFTARINGEPVAVAIAPDGSVYVAGNAARSFVTTEGAYQRDYGRGCTDPPPQIPNILPCGGDAFLLRAAANGDTLVFATLLGGSAPETLSALAVDSLGNAYLAGSTIAANFPTTPGVFRPVYGGTVQIVRLRYGDGFAAKFAPDGRTILWSTFVGGSSADSATGIAVDEQGNAYVTGVTQSLNFPTTPGAFQSTYGGSPDLPGLRGDIFLVKLDANGAAAFSTYLGGLENEIAPAAIAVNGRHLYLLTSPSITLLLENRTAGACDPRGTLIEFDTNTGLPTSHETAAWVPQSAILLSHASPRHLVLVGPTLTGEFSRGLLPRPGRDLAEPAARDFPLFVVLDFSNQPATHATCILNAGSFLDWRPEPTSITTVAPGEIVTIFGNGLANTTLYFDGRMMPLLYNDDTQINAIVPFDIALGLSEIWIVTPNGPYGPLAVDVAPQAPGFFANPTIAAIAEDGHIVTSAKPAARGSIVAMYATGLGKFTQSYANGSVVPVTPPFPQVETPFKLTIGYEELPMEILYAGPAPGLIAGVVQINARIPTAVNSGAQPIRFKVGGKTVGASELPVF